MVNTTSDIPTPEQFEKAQETHEDLEDTEPYDGPGFAYCYRVDEFDDYTAFLSFIAAKGAQDAAEKSGNIESQTDTAIYAAKIFLLALGAGALVEAVIGDARF